jgi:hypothetical protein
MSLKIENSRRNDESRPVCMDLERALKVRTNFHTISPHQLPVFSNGYAVSRIN